jgi:hypothetical protein
VRLITICLLLVGACAHAQADDKSVCMEYRRAFLLDVSPDTEDVERPRLERIQLRVDKHFKSQGRDIFHVCEPFWYEI